MKMEIENRRRAEQAVRDFLSAFGIAIEKRPGMEDTPKRVVAMYEEVWAGEQVDNEELVAACAKTFPCDSRDLVVVKDIEAFSYCEHHLALIYNMKISVGYFPRGRVIGLSKIARIANTVCRRLQLQERIGLEIASIMRAIVGEDVCVRIEANHSCMTARGVKKPSSKTVTYTREGVFRESGKFQEFLAALKG